MNREEKSAVIEDIAAELEGADAVFAVDYRGISVPQAAELRGALNEADASFNVVKNRLAKLATEKTGDQVLDDYLVGPTALTYVKGDPVIAAKAITKFISDHETISYKGGIMEGSELDADGFKAIAKLPGVETLHGQLVGLTASPLNQFVRTLNQLIGGLATQLGQIAEQGLVPAEGAAPEASAEETDDAPTGEPAPGDAGAPEVDAPDEESGESDNPGGDADVLPDESSDEGTNAADGGDESDGDSSEEDAQSSEESSDDDSKEE